MEERSQGNQEILYEIRELRGDIKRLQQGQQELHECFENRRGEHEALNLRVTLLEKLHESEKEQLKKSFGLYALLIAGIVGLVQAAASWFHRG